MSVNHLGKIVKGYYITAEEMIILVETGAIDKFPFKNRLHWSDYYIPIEDNDCVIGICLEETWGIAPLSTSIFENKDWMEKELVDIKNYLKEYLSNAENLEVETFLVAETS